MSSFAVPRLKTSPLVNPCDQHLPKTWSVHPALQWTSLPSLPSKEGEQYTAQNKTWNKTCQPQWCRSEYLRVPEQPNKLFLFFFFFPLIFSSFLHWHLKPFNISARQSTLPVKYYSHTVHSSRRFRAKFKGSCYLLAAGGSPSAAFQECTFPGPERLQLVTVTFQTPQHQVSLSCCFPWCDPCPGSLLWAGTSLCSGRCCVIWNPSREYNNGFVAVSSLPRKHLQCPKVWTQASCAAIPAFVKADRSQIRKMRQVEPVPLLLGSALKHLHWKSNLHIQLQVKDTELCSTLRPQKNQFFSWIDLFFLLFWGRADCN